MRTRFDQLYKEILGTLLRPVAHVEIGLEIPGHVLVADLAAAPDSARTGEMARLGLLGRMIAEGPCIIEPFSWPPSMREVHTCELKQRSFDHGRFLDSVRESRAEPPFVRLWIISAGRPEAVLRDKALYPMHGWPEGCWQCDRFHLIVTRDLPSTPDTLFVRLLGRGTSFTKALHELRDSPDKVALLKHIFIAFRREIPQDLFEEEQEDMEALRSLDQVYTEWLDEIRQEFAQREQQIREDALIESIETLCAALDIELTDKRRHMLATSDAAQLKTLISRLSTSRRWPDE